MVATVPLFAIATLEEIADLRLVNALGDAEIVFAMCEATVLARAAAALQEGPAKLRLLQVRRTTEFIRCVRVSARAGCALAALEEGAHLRLRELQQHRIVAAARPDCRPLLVRHTQRQAVVLLL